jgi:hypothetical protein
MSSASPEPQSDRTVLWRRVDEPWLERCTLARQDQDRGLWTMDGVVLGTSDGEPFEVRYSLSCDEAWITLGVSIEARIGTRALDLELEREEGIWLVNGSKAPELTGATDVDLGFTPATNTLPIRRLALEVGDSSEILTAWARFPEFTVEPFPQRYTRLADRRYLYESLTSDFMAELEVDELGLVVNYQGLFERQSESSAPSPPSRPTR